MLEPWGWENNENLKAEIVAKIHNVNKAKGKPVPVQTFVRDIEKALLQAAKEQPDVNELSREELLKIVKRDFGVT